MSTLSVDKNRQELFGLLQADDLDISLLGAFQVRVAGRDIVESDWPLRRARNLVKLLALATGHQIHREQIVDFLWPEQTQDAAANNLHKALHVARHVLEPNLPGKAISRYIQLQGELVVLRAPGQLRVDVEIFRALAETAYASDAPEAYLKALSVYVNDLLPQDPYEDWAMSPPRTDQTSQAGTVASIGSSVRGAQRDRFRHTNTPANRRS